MVSKNFCSQSDFQNKQRGGQSGIQVYADRGGTSCNVRGEKQAVGVALTDLLRVSVVTTFTH